MPLLAINGLECPVRVGSLRRPPPEEIGVTDRAESGTLRTHRRNKKRRFEFAITTVKQVEALAWEALIRGDGQVWSFDANLYSSKGLAPSAGYSAVLQAGGKYGANCLRITAGTTTNFPVGLDAGDRPPNWTVAVWRNESAVWKHYVVNSLAQKWVDGVRNDAASTTFLAVSSAGTVSLTGATGLTDFDDLVCFPSVMPTTWPPILYATNRAFPSMPNLEVYGDLIPGSTAAVPMTMRGESGGAEFDPARIESAWHSTAQALSVVLREV